MLTLTAAAWLVSGCADGVKITPDQPAGAHFRVWPGYDADARLHPYTSNMGPCPEGFLGSGCGDQPTGGRVISPSHYERYPWME